MRTWKVLIALIVATTPAACGSPDSDDGASLDTLVPPTEEVQDSPPPGATTTSDAASGGPVQPTTTTTLPGASSTGRPSNGGVTTTTRATGTGRTTTTTQGSTTTQPNGAPAPSKQTQTISFVQPSGTWAYGEHKSVVATASSELPVAFAATGACEVLDSLLGIIAVTDVGECNVTASQPGDGSWDPAPPVTRSIKTSKAASMITDFANRSIEYPQEPFSLNLTATASAGTVLQYRTRPDELGETLCSISGTALQVPTLESLPRNCVVEAYIEASPLFEAASASATVEITPTVIAVTGSTVEELTDASASISVSLNRVWDIDVYATCGSPEASQSGSGSARYTISLTFTRVVDAANPCTLTVTPLQFDQTHKTVPYPIKLP